MMRRLAWAVGGALVCASAAIAQACDPDAGVARDVREVAQETCEVVAPVEAESDVLANVAAQDAAAIEDLCGRWRDVIRRAVELETRYAPWHPQVAAAYAEAEELERRIAAWREENKDLFESC